MHRDPTSTSMGRTATSLSTAGPRIHATATTTITTIITITVRSTLTTLWSSKETTITSISVDAPHYLILAIIITTTTMTGAITITVCSRWRRVTASGVVHLTQGMEIIDTITTTITMGMGITKDTALETR